MSQSLKSVIMTERGDVMSGQETELRKRAVLRLSNTESNQLTRECIGTALIYLMNEYPFDKITVTAIIRRSGVSRAAFYRNYSSKEEVLREIGNTICERIAALLTEEKYREDPRQWYEDCFAGIRDNAEIFRLFMQAKLPPDFIFHTDRKKESEADRHGVPAKEWYRTIALQSAVKEIVINWFENGMKETPDQMAKICQELFQ